MPIRREAHEPEATLASILRFASVARVADSRLSLDGVDLHGDIGRCMTPNLGVVLHVETLVDVLGPRDTGAAGAQHIPTSGSDATPWQRVHILR